ncbi:uncharacterized protein N7483_008011 [Penicillium malachiteum]|uniref:uncharacterized protein n=1 Tax=Penicillium malachiteum TaxID=1324776 RepID=UPI0025469782|nr:uncharacterized protein N7483_008011 [Penicillium malachiteum]KAJ5726654.1 hypothetical protein N7483_008011 [Penicillium malachiteum]
MKLPRFLKSKSSISSERERTYIQGTNSHRSSVSRLSTRDLQLTSSNDHSSEHQKTHTQILDQLRGAKRLRLLKAPFLQPSEKTWIDGVLEDVTNVIRDVEVQRGMGNASLSIPSESRWRNRYDHEQAKEEIQRMAACHSTLSGVLNHLEHLETPKPTMVHEMGINDVTLIHEMPAYEDVILKPKLGIDSGLEVYPPPKGPIHSTRDSSGLEVASTVELSSFSQEMSDMLAWRRNKGSRGSNYFKKPGIPDRIDV